MSRNVKKGVSALLGGGGFVLMLIGVFTDVYSFWVGVILGISLWIVTGAVSTMMGVKD